MNEKARITLTPEQETLLIVLYARAQPGNPLFFDPKARDILSRVDYDFSRLRVPSGGIFQDGQTGASHRILPAVKKNAQAF